MKVIFNNIYCFLFRLVTVSIIVSVMRFINGTDGGSEGFIAFGFRIVGWGAILIFSIFVKKGRRK
ncbi:hypothetical protein D0U04_12605 [Bacillus clarus]|uniref:Uncharacterized protein n=1 Tax=Bacillus clarus TaxID=2338372 RepID=A0ABX9KVW6_9BACI|nr:hypothetical protein D0U04_12605 [Bacillus clarus]